MTTYRDAVKIEDGTTLCYSCKQRAFCGWSLLCADCMNKERGTKMAIFQRLSPGRYLYLRRNSDQGIGLSWVWVRDILPKTDDQKAASLFHKDGYFPYLNDTKEKEEPDVEVASLLHVLKNHNLWVVYTDKDGAGLDSLLFLATSGTAANPEWFWTNNFLKATVFRDDEIVQVVDDATARTDGVAVKRCLYHVGHQYFNEKKKQRDSEQCGWLVWKYDHNLRPLYYQVGTHGMHAWVRDFSKVEPVAFDDLLSLRGKKYGEDTFCASWSKEAPQEAAIRTDRSVQYRIFLGPDDAPASSRMYLAGISENKFEWSTHSQDALTFDEELDETLDQLRKYGLDPRVDSPQHLPEPPETKHLPWSVYVTTNMEGLCQTVYRSASQYFVLASAEVAESAHCIFIAHMFLESLRRVVGVPTK